MAYQKVSVTTVGQLQARVTDFVKANHPAWTVGTAGNKMTVKSPQNWYWCLDFRNDFLVGILAKQPYTGNFDQADNVPNTSANLNYGLRMVTRLAFPFVTMHCFYHADCFAFACELQTGVYVHWGFGMLTKWGTYDGGEWMAGTCRTPYVRGSNDVVYWDASMGTASWEGSFTGSTYGTASACFIRFKERFGNWATTSYSSNYAAAHMTPQLGTELVARYNSRTNLSPLGFLFRNDFGYTYSSPMTPLGYIPLVCAASIENNQPEDIVNNEWMLFPLSTKSTTANVARSGFKGCAYKKV